MQIFGFEIRKADEAPAIVPQNTNDGAVEQYTGSGAAYFSHVFDINGKLTSDVDRINRYRQMSMVAEIDSAIEEITAEAVVVEEEKLPVEVNVVATDDELPPQIREAIVEEFKNILALMEFNTNGHDLFRRWYVDGRLYGQILVDEQELIEGIKEIRFIDPRKIKKVREIQREKNAAGLDIITGTTEYFAFNDNGINTGNAAVRLSADNIIYAPSGITDETGDTIGYLSKTIKPANMLRYMEDAVLIYTLSRAPERRVFYVDVADMPKQKADQYMKDVMARYKNKIVYNQSTGELSDDRAHMSILEDFWLPRRCFSMSTKIKLLDGRDVSIQQLTDEYSDGKVNWTYSVSPDGTIVPGKITWAGVTMKDASVVDVHLDNGEVITCTPDHKFILRNGVECEAQNLVSGTSLMPLNTEKRIMYGKTTYDYVQDNKTNTWKPVHRMVSDYINGGRTANQVIHHINFDRYDNSPENLVIMNKDDHLKLHAESASDNWRNSPEEKLVEWKCKLSDSGKDFYKTDAGRKRIEEIKEHNKSDVVLNGLAKGREAIAKMQAEDKVALSEKEYRDKWVRTEHLSPTYAHIQRVIDKETMSPDEYYSKWVAPITNRNKQIYADRIASYDMNTIKEVIFNNFTPSMKNKDVISAVNTVYPEIKLDSFRGILVRNGYQTISDFMCRNFDGLSQRRKFKAKNQNATNHRVVKVVIRNDKMDVGTLTVDGDETLHSYHNYALSAGVFVKNSNGRSTEITTLPGSSIMQQMDNVNYFLNKLYGALNIPLSRMKPDAGFSLGRSTEITRDEIKFSKFVARLRRKFSEIFYQSLRVQLILKGIIAPEDWKFVKSKISFDFLRDNYFSELKDNEILAGRIQMAEQVQPFVGKYYSNGYIRTKILKQSEEEVEEMDKELAIEMKEHPEWFIPPGMEDQQQPQ